MSLILRRRWVAGLILGLGPVAQSSAQGPTAGPPPTPEEPAPSSPRPLVGTSPLMRPRPPIVQVPPGGFGSTWSPQPFDPIAMERHPPKFVEHKAHSWIWRRVQGKFWGYPEEFEPRPLGAAMYDNYRIMVSNGAEARMILHNYDFLPGSSELSPRGLDQLSKMAAQLSVSPFPLIVERTQEDPALAESRRYAVLARLARGPMAVGSERVLVGVPAANGLSGPDAQVIAGNALGRTQQYGPPIPIQSNGVNSPSGVTSPTGAGSNGGINP